MFTCTTENDSPQASIEAICAAIAKYRNEARNLPSRAYIRKSYLDLLKSAVPIGQPVKPALADFSGLPIVESAMLPQGVLCMFVNKDHMPLGMIVDDTYVPLKDSSVTSGDSQ